MLRQLYRSFVSENSPEAKGRTLLRQWLTAAQRRQFEEQGYFGLSAARLGGGNECNTGLLPTCGKPISKDVADHSCASLPRVIWVPGDVLLAQNISLETDELAALAVANRLAPVVRHVSPVQSWA